MKSGHQQRSRLPWLESAEDLDSGRSRIQELTSFWRSEFQVLDHDKHQIVAAIKMSRGQSRQVVSETRPEIKTVVREPKSP
jgi:hypothetical protein